MIRSSLAIRRRGATVVESAVILPATCFLVFGLVVGATGVFRYQEVASLAREGSRWASVHGSAYAQVTGHSAATAADVYQQAILPRAVGLDPAKLSYSVTWAPDNSSGSTVTVTVSYQWFPEVFVAGPINLTSTSADTMSY